MRARAAELEAIRAARAAAQEALERKIDSLQARQGALAGHARAGSSARSRPRRRRAGAPPSGPARPGWPAWPGSGRRPRGRPSSPATTTAGTLGGPNTTSYNYLTPNGKRIYGLVVRTFDVHSIGGWRPYGSVPGSDHPRGRAIDVMTWSNRSLGWRIASWAAGNAWALDVKYVIFNGRIWTRSRGWHGYRHPSDPCNCNPTLRHDDHVHISVL